MNAAFYLQSDPTRARVQAALVLAAPEEQWGFEIRGGFEKPWTVELGVRGPESVTSESVQALLARELGVEVAEIPGHGEHGMLVYASDGNSRWDPLPDDV